LSRVFWIVKFVDPSLSPTKPAATVPMYSGAQSQTECQKITKESIALNLFIRFVRAGEVSVLSKEGGKVMKLEKFYMAIKYNLYIMAEVCQSFFFSAKYTY